MSKACYINVQNTAHLDYTFNYKYLDIYMYEVNGLQCSECVPSSGYVALGDFFYPVNRIKHRPGPDLQYSVCAHRPHCPLHCQRQGELLDGE